MEKEKKKKKLKHFTLQDLYYLYIPEEIQTDRVNFIDRIYNLGFKKKGSVIREQNLYSYCIPIYRNLYDQFFELPAFKFWTLIYKSKSKGIYVPLVFVKDVDRAEEVDPINISKRDLRKIYRVIDKQLNAWMDLGIIKIAERDAFLDLAK